MLQSVTGVGLCTIIMLQSVTVVGLCTIIMVFVQL